ncbi:MAG: hypothetical protein Q8R24_02560 [Legionellaceae bacterium]|nr:hypothetical protein [Legionellaceae bacterium]
MSHKATGQYSGLFHDEETVFYRKLEKCVVALRHCAHDMVDFIDHLEHQTMEWQALKKSYFQLESMPVRDLYRGIEAIKTDLTKITFVSDKSKWTAKNQADFVDFFEIQNHFNAEFNALVDRAMKIEQWD